MSGGSYNRCPPHLQPFFAAPFDPSNTVHHPQPPPPPPPPFAASDVPQTPDERQEFMRQRLLAHMVPVVLIPTFRPDFVPNYPRFDPLSHRPEDEDYQDSFFFDENDENLLRFLDEEEGGGGGGGGGGAMTFDNNFDGGGSSSNNNNNNNNNNNSAELSEETIVADLSWGRIVAELLEERLVKNLRTRASSMEINGVDYEQEVCVVCLDGLLGETEKVNVTLGCGHVFHVKCITNWLFRKNECPICKSKALVFD